VDHPFHQTNGFIRISEAAFAFVYISEISLKLIVHRAYFFIGREWKWNWLDFILAATAAYDMTAMVVGMNWESGESENDSAINLTFVRFLRLARLSKVMRVFRVVRFVTELHVLLRAILISMLPLSWCMVMLAVFFYIFAVVFVNATAAYLADSSLDHSNKEDILKHWGSVSAAMISLYKATTGGADWGSVSDTLVDVGKIYYSLFLFFIAFIILALLNILTGIFVDRAMKASAEDKDGEAIALLKQEREIVSDLCRLHCVMSGSHVGDNGTLSFQEFEKHIASPAMRARFAVLGLEIWDSKIFFDMLRVLGSKDDVDVRTFVAGCMQLRGPSQRLGVQALTSKVVMLEKMVNQRLPKRSFVEDQSQV
jgi:hypothetical protein